MKIAISIGDLNGIGIEIALRAHATVRELCHPRYMIEPEMLQRAATLLGLPIPEDFETVDKIADPFEIVPGKIDARSGAYAWASFLQAVEQARSGKADAITTLPIHKKAWQLAGVPHKGHTDALASLFGQEAIMMIGCQKLFTALYTHHIPLREVPSQIDTKRVSDFLIALYEEIKEEKIGVLGLNPHAGDHGVLGNEEQMIEAAIEIANAHLLDEIFVGPLVPDTAFTPRMREHIHYYVCMYHDQGLIPAKTLYFEEAINVSLGLPIIRTSVDHGTAFDKAYKGAEISLHSYINAVTEAVRLATKKRHFRI
ncbi:MAG TPA: 4-hydroxythreonine-4-phosphate dehydrogenase [Campylobacteraceae bacterium]|nr:4-hydroxythreonine-4-phosphate dehydrogenase [Campylobacteraceae bacterium]HHD83746.1 4-hydroxythreonine-4-phosphate dehydrogenase [Campylobacteraceae bacterium]